MKCIEYDKRTVRTSNERAAEMVADGRAEYVSKSAWRSSGSEREAPHESVGVSAIHPPHGWLNRSNQKPRWAK